MVPRRMTRLPTIASLILAALLALSTATAAQVPAPVTGAADDALTPQQIAAIDAIAATVIERRATPSVAIGVARRGRLVFAKGYGYRNLDDQVRADPDTMYAIGSDNKKFNPAPRTLD